MYYFLPTRAFIEGLDMTDNIQIGSYRHAEQGLDTDQSARAGMYPSTWDNSGLTVEPGIHSYKPKTNTTGNPKDVVGSKKVNLSLVPPVANIYEAKVMELGAAKYGPYNWRDSPVKTTVYASAILRHLAAWADGQDIDTESGQSHIAHIRANTGILLDALAQGTLIDDRKTPGKAAEVLTKVEKK